MLIHRFFGIMMETRKGGGLHLGEKKGKASPCYMYKQKKGVEAGPGH